MNKHVMHGFNDEMQKLSTSIEDGVKGLGVGAILGAIIAAVGTEALERLVTRNKDLAIITGAIMGAGAMGGAGFLLGGKGNPPQPVRLPIPPISGTDIYQGVPPVGTPISAIRHI